MRMQAAWRESRLGGARGSRVYRGLRQQHPQRQVPAAGGVVRRQEEEEEEEEEEKGQVQDWGALAKEGPGEDRGRRKSPGPPEV